MDSNHKISNTFGIDVTARHYAEYSDETQLIELLDWHHTHYPTLPILNIGEGSNLLFTESEYQGLVLRPAPKADIQVNEGNNVTVWAGMKMDDFIAWSIERGLYGLENLSWIPGTVGASAVQNIGAYGAEACQHIAKVECVDSETLQKRVFTNSECKYSYRDSVFKHQRQWIVTRVTYRLDTLFIANTSYGGIAQQLAGQHPTAMDVRNAVIGLRKNKLPDYKKEGNAGSFFMNPVVSSEEYATLVDKHGDMPHYPATGGGIKLSAAWLIEQSGWKGRSLGRAGVSEKHALILINKGGATGNEIVRLCRAVQDSVHQRFGVTLKPEVNFL